MSTEALIRPVLYHKGKKDKIYSWRVFVTGNVIYTEYGEVDGKKQLSQKEAEPKNVGRSNETTAEEQAELEATSMWQNKLDRKYRRTIEEAKEPLPLPMLAKDFFKREKYVQYPVYSQPKLDGIRCLAQWWDGKLELTSRSGKPLDCPHILKEIASIKPQRKELILDGELYIHNESFQTITSLVKRPRKESKAVKFHVYDIISLGDSRDLSFRWCDRLTMLKYFFEGERFRHLVLTPTIFCEDRAAVISAQREWVEEGYEGAIVRLRHGKYLFGYRSDELLKVKNFIDDEYEVVGWNLGVGKMRDVPTWRCVTNEGKEFDVLTKGTMEYRRSLKDVADQYVGRWLKVKYFETTDAGIPRFPVGVGFRIEEDMS